MFDAGNLIILGVVLVILIAYRILDRDNRSLEKVKKYTDRLKEELDAFAAERAEALKSYAVEVDAHKKSAKEVLRQVQDAEKDLTSRAEAISGVAKRIAEYDKALLELKQMSARVDENLRIIHDESAFVDGLAKNIRSARQDIDHLLKEIPAIRADAVQAVDGHSQELRGQFDKAMAAAMAATEEQLSVIRQELDQAFIRAEKEAKQLEGASFQQLRQHIEAEVLSIEQGLSEDSERLRQEIAGSTTRIEQDLSLRFTQVSSLADTNDAKLSELIEQRFGEIQRYGEERGSKLEAMLENRLDGIRDQAKEKLQETQHLLKGFKQDWRKDAEDILEQTRLRAEAVQAAIEPMLQANEQRCQQTEAAFAERLSRLEDKANETAQALQARIKEALKSQQEELVAKQQEVKNHLKADLQTAQQEARQLASAIEESLKHSGTSLAQAASRQDEQLAALTAGLNEVDAQARAKIEALSDKFTSRSADLESRVLSGFEKRTEDLRNLLDQGLHRLEASRIDVIALEKSLRTTMGGVEKRVEEDFALFAKDLVGRHEAFEAKMAAEAAKLHVAMKALDEDLNTLKANAYENVSEKLKVFEDEFFADLRKRREDADQKLLAWRSSLDERMAAALHDADNARAEAERAWLAEARQRAGEIQQRVATALDKLASQVDAHRASITERVGEADAALDTLKKAVKTDLEEARSATQAFVNAELARWQHESGQQLQKLEQRLSQETARLQELAGQSQALFDAAREGLAGELQDYTQVFSGRIAEASSQQGLAIDRLQESWSETLGRLTGEWQQEREQLVEGSRAEREALNRELRGLGDELDRLRQELTQKSGQAIDDFARSFETMQHEAAKRLRETEQAMSASVETYRKEEKNLQSSFQAAQDRLSKGLEEERKEREKVFGELDKQLKAFQTQTRLFERADELKSQLSEAIEAMKADMTKADSRRAEMVELETQYTRIKRAEDELSQKIARFFAEKRRIDTMEEDFRRLLSLSQGVDQKLASVTASHDQLTQLQADMRRLMDAANEANDKYERVEKKSNILDATADAIDKNFQAITELERNVRSMDADIRDVPERIIQLKRSMEEIAAVEPRINATIDRLDNMDQIMSEAEKRANELQKAREWLARAETRFEELNKKTTDHLKLLNDILKDEPSRGKDKSGAPPLSVQESVRKLAHQGWKTEEIARAVKLSRGEVELILELSGDK